MADPTKPNNVIPMAGPTKPDNVIRLAKPHEPIDVTTLPDQWSVCPFCAEVLTLGKRRAEHSGEPCAESTTFNDADWATLLQNPEILHRLAEQVRGFFVDLTAHNSRLDVKTATRVVIYEDQSVPGENSPECQAALGRVQQKLQQLQRRAGRVFVAAAAQMWLRMPQRMHWTTERGWHAVHN